MCKVGETRCNNWVYELLNTGAIGLIAEFRRL